MIKKTVKVLNIHCNHFMKWSFKRFSTSDTNNKTWDYLWDYNLTSFFLSKCIFCCYNYKWWGIQKGQNQFKILKLEI